MNTTRQDDSAFPGSAAMHAEQGMTKREYFASQAMLGLLIKGWDEDAAARRAVKISDLLIEELNKKQE